MKDRVFTGDTLLINGTGRTDFQGGSAKDQYNSIFNNLLKLPEKHLCTLLMIIMVKNIQPLFRKKIIILDLQVNSLDEYEEIMNNLNLLVQKLWILMYLQILKV